MLSRSLSLGFSALVLWATTASLACSATNTTDSPLTTTAGSTTSGGTGGQGGAISGAGGLGSTSASTSDITIAVGSGGGNSGPPGADVNVVITADNAYSFGYGDVNGIDNFTQGSRAQLAGEIFNCGPGPEAYTVPGADAPNSAFLYVVTWDDLAVSQGVLGQFRRVGGDALYTGDASFEVCATGINLQNSQNGPSQAEINAEILKCNAGSGDKTTTSAGWVNSKGAVTPGAVGTLAIGEENSSTPGGKFPPTCPTDIAPPGSASIDNAAHWMWYNPGGVADPFGSTGSNTFRAYLIFRLAAEDIPPPVN